MPMSVPHALFSRPALSRWLSVLLDACLAGIIVIVPGLSALTFERGELYKQGLLVGLVGLALVACSCAFVLDRRAEVRLHWSQVLLAVFGCTVLGSSLLSVHPFLSFIGQFSQRGWAFSTVAALLIFAWLLIQRIGVLPSATFVSLFILGSLTLTCGGILSLLQRGTFTSAGSVYALAVYAAVGLIGAVGCLLLGLRRFGGIFALSAWPGSLVRGGVWFLILTSLIVLVAVDFWLAWVMVLVGGGVVLFLWWWFLQGRVRERAGIGLLLGVMLAACMGLALPLPWQAMFSGEVALSQRASWETVQQTVFAHPWFGSGPGTWVYDHGLYRSPVFNASPFWATRFDRGISVLLTLFATVGMLGTVVFLVLLVSIFGMTFRFLFRTLRARASVSHPLEHSFAGVVFFAAWIPMVLAMGFYSFHISHQILFWTLTGCLLGLSPHTRWMVESKRAFGSWFLPLHAAIVTLGVLVVLVKGGQLVWAERQTEEVVRLYRSGQVSVTQLIERLETIRVIHPWDDVSTRTLSQAYLVHVLAQVKDRPANERAQAVGEEVRKMVDVALEATRLAPANAENWANAGLVYGSVAPFTQGAETFGVAMYQEALRRDPQHPEYPYQIGIIFLLQAQRFRMLIETKDLTLQQRFVQQEQEALQQALQWMERALSLKSDYLPARYQRAVILHRQGKKEEALRGLETVVLQDPSVDHIFELGVLYGELGDRARAMAAFEKVISMDGGQVRARWQLVSLYEEAGRLSDALAQLRLVAESAPTNTAVQSRLQTLKQRIEQIR